MKAVLEKLLGKTLEEFDQPSEPLDITDHLVKKYGYISKVLEEIIKFTPVFLLSVIKTDGEVISSEILFIVNLYQALPKLEQSELRDNLSAIAPYIYLKFLIERFMASDMPMPDKQVVAFDSFAQSLILEMDKIGSLQIEDDFLLAEIYQEISNLVPKINSLNDFKKYRNLIYCICNIYPTGGQILIYLIDQIYLQTSSKDLALLEDIINNLQRSGQDKATEIAAKPLKEECQKILTRKQKEIEFAKIKTIDPIEIIEIFNFYGDDKSYNISTMSVRIIFLALRYLDTDLSRTDLYCLIMELNKKGNFLNLLVKHSSKAKLDAFCELIKGQKTLPNINKDDIIIQIQSHEDYKSKRQEGRLQIITGINENDLDKAFDIIVRSEEIDNAKKPFFSDLYLLSNQISFQALSRSAQIEKIKFFIDHFENFKSKSDHIVIASAYCLVKSILTLMNCPNDEIITDQEAFGMVIKDVLSQINLCISAIQCLIANDELPTLNQDIKVIYQKLAGKVKGSDDIKNYIEQIFLLGILGLGQEEEFRFLITELHEQYRDQVIRLKEIFKSLKDSEPTITIIDSKCKILLKPQYQELLNDAIKEIDLCPARLNLTNAIFFLRYTRNHKKAYSLPILIDKTLQSIRQLFAQIDFNGNEFSIAIKEMKQVDDFLNFFIEQQSLERIDQLIQFLQSKNQELNMALIAKIFNHPEQENSELWLKALSQPTSTPITDDFEKRIAELNLTIAGQKATFEMQIAAIKKERDVIAKQLEQKEREIERISQELAQSIIKKTKESSEKVNKEAQKASQKLQSQNSELEKQVTTFRKQIEEDTKILQAKQKEHSKIEVLLSANVLKLQEKEQEIAWLKDAGAKLQEKYQLFKKQIKALQQEVTDTKSCLKEVREKLTQEQKKHLPVAALSSENIDKKLQEKSAEILTKIQTQFGNITDILKQKIAFERLEIYGSQIYVPLLKMLDNKDMLFKDDSEPKDLDLILVLQDEDFDQRITKQNAEQFLLELLPGFKIQRINSNRELTSISVKLEFQGQEIDCNIYKESCYETFCGWHFYADRTRLCFKRSSGDWQFEINNNQTSDDNQFTDCRKFLLGLKDGSIDLWQANLNAKGFLGRILRDCGRLKIPFLALDPIQGKLLYEMTNIIAHGRQIGRDYNNWNIFAQYYCQNLADNSRKHELAMVKNIHQICTLQISLESLYASLQPIASTPFAAPSNIIQATWLAQPVQQQLRQFSS
jgi:hypothetical protein